jgi:hypothetical protein
LILADKFCVVKSVQQFRDCIVVAINSTSISVDKQTGLISYRFRNGIRINYAHANVTELRASTFLSSEYSFHEISTAPHDKLVNPTKLKSIGR